MVGGKLSPSGGSSPIDLMKLAVRCCPHTSLVFKGVFELRTK
jgi:hypothetical protein